MDYKETVDESKTNYAPEIESLIWFQDNLENLKELDIKGSISIRLRTSF